MFTAANEASFLVYDDDGHSYKYENGDYLRQQIRGNDGVMTLTIAPATGSYRSPLRTYLTQMLQVSINDRLLPRTWQDLTDSRWKAQQIRDGRW